MHLPKQMLHKDSDAVVIFIHGFMGTPDQFAELMDAVYAKGLSAVSVLLPGHGGSGFDFAKSTAEDWLRSLREEMSRYQDYKKIYLVGHSIGGLLALNIAVQFDISGIIAISTPLKIYLFNPFSNFKRLKILFSKKDNEIKKCYIRCKSIGKPYYRTMPLWLRVMLQPHRLIRRTKKNLDCVTVPVLTFHSKNDETVCFKSAKLFEKLLVSSQHESITLKDSLHAYYCDSERESIVKTVAGFVSS